MNPPAVNAFDMLEALRTFEKRHAERAITQRVYSFAHGGKEYAVASNGWAMLAVRAYLISKTALNGLRMLPNTYVDAFAGYFEPGPKFGALDVPLKRLRDWCGAPKLRRCPRCEQTIDVKRHGGNLFDRAIDRNLIAMAIAFGNEDAPIVMYPQGADPLSPIVFRHEHFLAVVMPMREPIEGLPIYPEHGS